MNGNRRITIKDIADAAGVSTALVSFVMNDKCKRYRVSDEMARKIKTVAAELNYQPNQTARSLRNGRTRTIGVIVSDISNKFFADIARCIEDKAYESNYTVIFGSSDENARKLENLLNVLINKGVDGLVIVPCEDSESIIAQVVARRIPVVLLDRSIGNLSTDRVVLDNRKAMALAVEQLFQHGYRRIGMFSYDMNLSNIREREQGYLEMMQLHGLDENARIRRIRYNEIQTDIEKEIGDILQQDRNTDAIVFATNSLTVAGLKVLNRYAVRIPEDIAVVGFDESEAFELYYTSVTYVRQPIGMFGFRALELLIRQIEGNEPFQVEQIILEPELVVGESSLKR